ncbi:hypothetical protein [uncultured Thiodictyon sp.]|jgi:hypothetical protein|uniref:hypothetical protein n=1 Tax=uncultured Thiodictyon sp. TaxID=1846217 RepID=UPI0025F8946E|nr:hypothetical protein [uncultured Thiodictyon sp.]
MRLRLLFLLLTLVSPVPAAMAVQQAFLIQNSGWMEPFYSDPQSLFKPLILAVFHTVTRPEDKVFVSVFNQSVGENKSPALVYSNNETRSIDDVIADIKVAKKPKSNALTDTHFQEAVTSTIVDQFQGKSGIIWIFTNNKNSPNNDSATVMRNREFYELVHNEPTITRTLAFPLGMPVKGRVYQATGIMVYALAYGDEADAALRSLIDSGRAGQVFTEKPARLKPLDRDSVRLLPQEIRNQPGTTVGLAADQRTVVLDVAVAEQQPSVEILASLENLFYPYIIESADISASFAVASSRSALSPEPSRIALLEPGARKEIRVTLPIPLGQIPSIWSIKALRSLGTRFEIHGTLELELSNQRLILSDAFRNNLNTLFPGDLISEVFAPPQDALSSQVSIPFVIRIIYPTYPILLIGLALLVGLGSILSALILGNRPRVYQLRIDGQAQTCRLKPFCSQQLYSAGGESIARVRRGIARIAILDRKEGHSVEVGQ